MGASSAHRPGVISAAAGLLMLAAVCFALSFTPLRSSHDEWWHLKTGQYIDEHGLPENEIFTYTAENMPWHNHEWLAQVVLWRIWRAGEIGGIGGVRAVIAFKTLTVLMTFTGLGVFGWWWTGRMAPSLVSAALACGLARRTLYPRPPFISYALMALVYSMLLAWRSGRLRSRWLFVLPPVFALWANLHGGFMAGLVIVASFWGDSLVIAALGWWRCEHDQRERVARSVVMTAALVLSFMGTLATPYGIELYMLAARVLNDARLAGIIFELQPPDWHYVWIADLVLLVTWMAAAAPGNVRSAVRTIVAGVLLLSILRGVEWVAPGLAGLAAVKGRECAAVVLFAVICFRNTERLGLGVFLLLCFFMVQAFEHVRHLPLLGIVLAPALAVALADWPHAATHAWDEGWRKTPPGHPDPRAASIAEEALTRRVAFGSFGLLGVCAAFHLFFPGEAWNFVSPPQGVRSRADLLRSPSGLAYNVALLRGQELQPGSYPVEAVEALLRLDPPRRLWNGGNYAGYLIWRLSPEKYKVFTDNRYDIYGGDFIEDELTVRDVREGWREVLEKWGVRTLFVNRADPIQRELEGRRNEFDEIHRDRGFAIWVKRDNQPLLP